MIALYLQINLWIAFAFILFQLLPKLDISFRARKVLAQSLLVASIALPLICANLPAGLFPQNKPTSETSLVADRASDTGKAATLRRAVSQSARSATASIRETTPTSMGWWTWLFALGFFINVFLRLNEFRKLQRLLDESFLLHQIGRVKVVVSEAIDVPFSAWMLTHATIALPAALVRYREDFRIALRHEAEHHRRRDTHWAQAIELIIACFYLNPAIYAWKKTLLQLQELACDEALINRMRVPSHAYGSCLLRVAETAFGKRKMYVGTTCMIPPANKNSHSFLLRRIKMFTHHERPSASKRFAIALGTFSCLTLAGAAFATQAILNTPHKPNPGSAVFDSKLQEMAKTALQKGLIKSKASAGFAIVADATRGTVLAAVSLNEGFDPKLKGDWALSYPMEPASGLKSLILASALQHKVTSPGEIIDTGNGEYLLGSMLNHDVKALGKISAADTVVHSSNIGVIKIAEKLGAKGLENVFHEFGMGTGETVREFPSASKGYVPPAGVIPDDNYISLVAQGVASRTGLYVTPLEMVQAYGAIANGGRLLRAIPANGTKSPELIRQVLSPEIASGMRGILRRVVTEGTASGIRKSTIALAGKTSTNIINGSFRVGGFIGFAPADKPELVIYVAVIDPQIPNAYGSTTAAPIFRDLAEIALPEWQKRF